jgi:hypothetical protein
VSVHALAQVLLGQALAQALAQVLGQALAQLLAQVLGQALVLLSARSNREFSIHNEVFLRRFQRLFWQPNRP